MSKCHNDHICPDCGSTQIIEIQSPDMPINTRSPKQNGDGPKLNEDQIPEVNQAEINWYDTCTW